MVKKYYCLIPSYEIDDKIKNIKLTIEIINKLNFPSFVKYLFASIITRKL